MNKQLKKNALLSVKYFLAKECVRIFCKHFEQFLILQEFAICNQQSKKLRNTLKKNQSTFAGRFKELFFH